MGDFYLNFGQNLGFGGTFIVIFGPIIVNFLGTQQEGMFQCKTFSGTIKYFFRFYFARLEVPGGMGL